MGSSNWLAKQGENVLPRCLPMFAPWCSWRVGTASLARTVWTCCRPCAWRSFDSKCVLGFISGSPWLGHPPKTFMATVMLYQDPQFGVRVYHFMQHKMESELVNPQRAKEATVVTICKWTKTIKPQRPNLCGLPCKTTSSFWFPVVLKERLPAELQLPLRAELLQFDTILEAFNLLDAVLLTRAIGDLKMHHPKSGFFQHGNHNVGDNTYMFWKHECTVPIMISLILNTVRSVNFSWTNGLTQVTTWMGWSHFL